MCLWTSCVEFAQWYIIIWTYYIKGLSQLRLVWTWRLQMALVKLFISIGCKLDLCQLYKLFDWIILKGWLNTWTKHQRWNTMRLLRMLLDYVPSRKNNSIWSFKNIFHWIKHITKKYSRTKSTLKNLQRKSNSRTNADEI